MRYAMSRQYSLPGQSIKETPVDIRLDQPDTKSDILTNYCLHRSSILSHLLLKVYCEPFLCLQPNTPNLAMPST